MARRGVEDLALYFSGIIAYGPSRTVETIRQLCNVCNSRTPNADSPLGIRLAVTGQEKQKQRRRTETAKLLVVIRLILVYITRMATTSVTASACCGGC